MSDGDFDGLMRNASRLASDGREGTADSVLEALQKAVEEQERILARQGRLIRKLRSELNGVEADGRDRA